VKEMMWRYRKMTINYMFNGDSFDYEINLFKAMEKILNKFSKEELIEFILDSHGCNVDLKVSFMEELKEHFEEEAYKEYLDRRYE
jgi:hypothetical protein